MKIFSLILTVSDSTNSLVVTQDYTLAIYSTIEKAKVGINTYNKIFEDIIKLQQQIQIEEKHIAHKAKTLQQPRAPIHWSPELKTELDTIRNKMHILTDKVLPLAKDLIFPILNPISYSVFPLTFKIIETELH